jgi:hypothetical protein
MPGHDERANQFQAVGEILKKLAAFSVILLGSVERTKGVPNDQGQGSYDGCIHGTGSARVPGREG